MKVHVIPFSSQVLRANWRILNNIKSNLRKKEAPITHFILASIVLFYSFVSQELGLINGTLTPDVSPYNSLDFINYPQDNITPI